MQNFYILLDKKAIPVIQGLLSYLAKCKNFAYVALNMQAY